MFFKKKAEDKVVEEQTVEVVADPIQDTHVMVDAVKAKLESVYAEKQALLEQEEAVLNSQQVRVNNLRVEMEKLENTMTVLETLHKTTAPEPTAEAFTVEVDVE